MFKKYLSTFIFAFLFSFLSLNHSQAFTLQSNACNTANITETVTVISQVDMSGVIPLCVNATANFPINVYFHFQSPENQFYTINTSGQTHFNYPQSGVITLASLNQNNQYNFYVSDSAGQDSSAQILIFPVPAPITLTASPAITEGETIAPNTSETFTCTNATEMYYDGTLVDTDYNGSTGYNLSYTTTPTNGSHTVECDNIGAGLTRKILHFNVAAGMAGVLTAPSCSIAVGASSCSTTISWETYNPVATSAVTSETNGSGNASAGNVKLSLIKNFQIFSFN